MLQDIRQQVQGTTAKIIVGLIVVSFAFFGIESILLGGGGNEIAEVNGESVFPHELQQALDTQKRRLLSIMGNDIDPAMLDDDRLRPQAMESLINRKLLMQSAENLSLSMSEAEIGRVVSAMEQFQVDGVFSPDLYKSVLASLGYTPSYFKDSLREDMILNQLGSGLAGSEFVTVSELEVNNRVASELRDINYFVIPREDFAPQVAFTDQTIETYYSNHQEDFRSPESVDIDYLELTLDDYRKPVEENAVLEAFELAKADSQYQMQNRVSHILLESSDTEDQNERLQKARGELDTGTPFAEVAKKYSDDVGSAEKGGDLGYTSGQTFPEALEEAIAELEPGVVSEPIETDAGIHLVVVTERKPGGEPSLEEMREQLTETIQTDDARIALLRDVESLKDLSFNAEDLSYPAKELDLDVQQADTVSRSMNEGLFSNSTLIDAAYSEEVLTSGHNSEVIELPDDRFVVLRVRKHNKSEVMPLEAVKEEVISRLADEASKSAVIAKAEALLKQIRGGQDAKAVASGEGYEMRVELAVNRRNPSLPPEVLQRAFELPIPNTENSITEIVMAPNGDVAVMELLRVNVGDYKTLPETEQQQLRQLLGSEYSGLLNNEFQRGIRDKAEVSVL